MNAESTTGGDGVAAPNRLAWTVAENVARERLDRWLSRQVAGRARNQVQLDIAAGRVRVDGQVEPARHLVAPGQRVEYDVPPAVVVERLMPEAIALDVVFEDADVIVVDKPAGLVMHPAPGHSGGTLANALLAHCGPSLEGVGGQGRWGLVHRLDAGTSGLLVAAKTAMAYEALVAALAERKIHRQYLGLAVSLFGEATGAIDRPVGRRHGDRKRMGVTRDGRPARTDWRVLLQSDGLALLALTLHSGRTHQIRVHLQSIGHPVLGDADYGWTRSRVLAALAPSMRVDMARAWPARPMLHAARLRLEHPAQPGKFLEFLAPPPPDFDPIAVAFWGDAWREKIAFED